MWLERILSDRRPKIRSISSSFLLTELWSLLLAPHCSRIPLKTKSTATQTNQLIHQHRWKFSPKLILEALAFTSTGFRGAKPRWSFFPSVRPTTATAQSTFELFLSSSSSLSFSLFLVAAEPVKFRKLCFEQKWPKLHKKQL